MGAVLGTGARRGLRRRRGGARSCPGSAGRPCRPSASRQDLFDAPARHARRCPVAAATALGTEAGIGQRRQLHQPGAIGEVVQDIEGHLDGEPGLPDAARSHDADSTPVPQQRAESVRSSVRPTKLARRNGRLWATTPIGRSGGKSVGEGQGDRAGTGAPGSGNPRSWKDPSGARVALAPAAGPRRR